MKKQIQWWGIVDKKTKDILAICPSRTAAREVLDEGEVSGSIVKLKVNIQK